MPSNVLLFLSSDAWHLSILQDYYTLYLTSNQQEIYLDCSFCSGTSLPNQKPVEHNLLLLSSQMLTPYSTPPSLWSCPPPNQSFSMMGKCYMFNDNQENQQLSHLSVICRSKSQYGRSRNFLVIFLCLFSGMGNQSWLSWKEVTNTGF